jgi:protein-tyrosine phosphatase
MFLCTGNYYRSRFAHVLFNELARRDELDWVATSRGLKLGWPGNVGPISPHTKTRLAEMGINSRDIAEMPVECTAADLESADLTIALKEDEHRPMLAGKYAGWENRVTYWHVHDVDGAAPEQALAEIEQLVERLIDELGAR